MLDAYSAFLSRSDQEHSVRHELSNSKVMMTEARVEPLNCSSWWPGTQGFSCLVSEVAWREGCFQGDPCTRGQPRTTREWNRAEKSSSVPI